MATANSKLLIDFGFESRGTSNVTGDLDVTGTLSVGGDLAFTGTTVGNFIPDLDQRSLGNTVNRWNLQGYVANIASTLTVAGITTLQDDVTLAKTLSGGNTTITGFANVTTSVNSALLTVGSSFIANTTGLYHTGLVNAASYNTSGIVANTIAIAPTSNTILLGNSIGRFVLSANTADLSGQLTVSGNTTLTGNATLNGTVHTIAGNSNFDNGVFFVDGFNNRVGVNNAAPTVALEVTGSANISTSVNTSLLTVGSSFIANTTGAYHTGTVNAANFTTTGILANTTAIVPTSNTILLGNSIGRFVLSANTGDFTGVVTGTSANMSTSVNSALITVGTSFIANATGVYHTGTVNAASHTVGTSLIANTTGVYHTGTVNAASHTVGTSFIANTAGVYHTGTVNAASHTVGTIGASDGFLANATHISVGNSTINVAIATGSITTSGALGGIRPASNSDGTLLGSSSRRWVLNANTGNFSGAITGTTGSFSGTMEAQVFNSTSDINSKYNIKTIEDPISKVMALRGVTFTWKNSDKNSMGLIAQEVEQVIPEVVNTDSEGKKSVSYDNVIGLLIEAIKRQQIQIDSLMMDKVARDGN
jgi:hypothetical protein